MSATDWAECFYCLEKLKTLKKQLIRTENDINDLESLELELTDSETPVREDYHCHLDSKTGCLEIEYRGECSICGALWEYTVDSIHPINRGQK